MDELKVRRVRASDFKEIRRWYALRGMKITEEDVKFFPKTGYIVDGVAAGFLYLTQVIPIGLLDGYIANPEQSEETRSFALDLVTQMLIGLAQAKRMRRLVCQTQIPEVAFRASRHGFEPMGNYILMKRKVAL